MKTLILITPVLRTDNLIKIGRNIIKTFEKEEYIKPHWVMCFDRYHADMDPLKIKTLEVLCLKHKLNYSIYAQGEDKDANYGGALMNKPLQDLKRKMYKDDNPYVYILDDDNILSPNILCYMHNKVMSDETGCIWWLNMLDEYGAHRFSRRIDRLAGVKGAGVNQGYYVIHPCASCDPSQVIIKLDTILELGGYGSTRMYDYDFMNKILMNEKNIQPKVRYQGDASNIRDSSFYISCYHNGLVSSDEITKTIQDINANKYPLEDSYIHVHVGNHMYNLPMDNGKLKDILFKYNWAEYEEV